MIASIDIGVVRWAHRWSMLWSRLSLRLAERCTNAMAMGHVAAAHTLARRYRAARARQDDAYWIAYGEMFADVRAELAAKGVGQEVPRA